MTKVALMLTCWLACTSTSLAKESQPEQVIYDETGILRPKLHAALESILSEHFKSTGQQIAVGIYKDTGGQPLQNFTRDALDAAKLEETDKGEGLLLVVDWKTRRARIEVTEPLESVISESQAETIIRQSIMPWLKAKDLNHAIASFALETLTLLGSPAIETGRAQREMREAGIDLDALAPSPMAEPVASGGGWVAWIVVGMVCFAMAWSKALGADAHFTGSGWFRPSPWKSELLYWRSLLKPQTLPGGGGTSGEW